MLTTAKQVGLTLVTVGGLIVSAVGFLELVKSSCPPPPSNPSTGPTNILGVR